MNRDPILEIPPDGAKFLTEEDRQRQNSLASKPKAQPFEDLFPERSGASPKPFEDLFPEKSAQKQKPFEDLFPERSSEVTQKNLESKPASFEINAPGMIESVDALDEIATNSRKKSQEFLDIVPNAAAGVVTGTLGMSESIYRTPEMLGRGVNALGETLSYVTKNPKIKEAVSKMNILDPETGMITRGGEIFGKKFSGSSDLADSIHVANTLLPALGGAFERNAKLAKEADEGFNELIEKGNPKKLLNTVLNPSAWAGFIGQAAPSLATAIASGGSMAFMGWLEAAGSANDIADYEKKMGGKVKGTDAVNSMAQAGIINAALEKAGVMPYLKKFQAKAKPVVERLSMKIFKMFANAAKEGTTEGLQQVNSELASMNYDKTLTLQDLRRGVAASFIGGFGAGGTMDIAMEIYSKSNDGLPPDIKKTESKQIATESDFKDPPKDPPASAEPVKTEAVKEAEKIGKVVGIDAETKLPIIDTKQQPSNENIGKLDRNKVDSGLHGNELGFDTNMPLVVAARVGEKIYKGKPGNIHAQIYQIPEEGRSKAEMGFFDVKNGNFLTREEAEKFINARNLSKETKIIEEAGGKVKGVQKIPARKDGTPNEDKIMIDLPWDNELGKLGTVTLDKSQVTPENVKSKLDALKTRMGVVAPIDRGAQAEVPKVAQDAPPAEQVSQPIADVQAPKARKKRVYNEDKAAERGDRATLIKAFGGWSDKPGKAVGAQAKADNARLLQFRRKGAQGIDELLDELKGQYPQLFDKYSTGEGLRSAVLDGTINEGKKANDHEQQTEKQIAQHEAEQERIHAEARQIDSLEPPSEEGIRQAEADIDPASEDSSSFAFGENVKPKQPEAGKQTDHAAEDLTLESESAPKPNTEDQPSASKWYHGGAKGLGGDIFSGMVTKNYEEAKQYAEQAGGAVYEIPAESVIEAKSTDTGNDGENLGKNYKNYGFIKSVKAGQKGVGKEVVTEDQGKIEDVGEKIEFGSENKIVTKADLDAAIKEFKDKTTGLRSNLDPTALKSLVKIGTYYFEGGARSFASWSKKMLEDLGDSIRPHLQNIWDEIQNGFNKNEQNITGGAQDQIKTQEDAEASAAEFKRQKDLFDPEAPEDVSEYGKYDGEKLKDIGNLAKGFRDVFRNFEVVFGEQYPEIAHTLLLPFVEANGVRVDMQSKWLDKLNKEVVQKLGIKKGSDMSAAVQEYGEGYVDQNGNKQKLTRSELEKKYGKDKADRIIKADEWFRAAYNELIDNVNAALRQVYPGQTEKQIPYRRDYYRHFREFSELTGLMNIFDSPANISPKLAGVSRNTKPNSKWLSFAQRRLGLETDVDAVGGFLSYVPSASYATHVTPFIKKFRGLRKWLAAEMDGSGKINNFLEYLDLFANDLAGKTGVIDRDIQSFIPGGRKTMRVLDWMNNRVKANVILGNLSSVMAQVFNIPQGVGSAKQYSFGGLMKMIPTWRDKNSPINQSTFIKTRYADSAFDKFDTGLLSHAKNFLKWFMVAADEVATRFIWQSHYEKAIAQKMKDPSSYANVMARKMVAGRSVGEVPLIHKSKVFQLFSPFMVEVGNLVWVMGDKIKGKDLAGLLIFAIVSFLFNDLAEKIKKDRVSYDPIGAGLQAYDKDATWYENLGKISAAEVGEVLGNLPLGDKLAALYPEYGFKVNGTKFPTRKEFFGRTDPTRFGSGLLVKRGFDDPVFKLFLPFAGNQIKKSKEALSAFRAGFYKIGNKTKSIEQSPRNLLTGLAFGKYAMREKDEELSSELERAKRRAQRQEKDISGLKSARVENASIAQKNGQSLRDYEEGMNRKERSAFEKSVTTLNNKRSPDTLIRHIASANTNNQKMAIMEAVFDNYADESDLKEFLIEARRKKLFTKEFTVSVVRNYRKKQDT